MRTSDVAIIIVPGPNDATPDHWYARWEQKLPTARRLAGDHRHLTPDDGTLRLVEAVEAADKPVVLVGHADGVIVIAHAADRIAERVAGAFLVAAPSAATLRAEEDVDPGFAAVPLRPLPFPAVLVASRDDPGATWEESEALAAAWHVELVDAGFSGHLDDASGHGPWPEGLMRFAGFLKTLS